ncbi:uncharacterized protein LOC133506535 [Syngnathoides biaculeatus]|uniref:uncharacterized protein LOC133506535 n=1 Tax=Syngnathoides biaculeatus TaxID=300417 RepID=UPI002ADE0F2A|nr:uncharacterized protein LOC133506535 [Syngnathoides biaculeatus]
MRHSLVTKELCDRTKRASTVIFNPGVIKVEKKDIIRFVFIMSFSNHFANLPVNGAKSNDQPSHPISLSDGIGKLQKSTRAQKRMRRNESPGFYRKKPCHQTQSSRIDFSACSQGDYSNTINYHLRKNTDHENTSTGFATGGPYNYGSNTGPNFKTKVYVNQQQTRKKKMHQKGQQREQRQTQNQGGRHQMKTSKKSGVSAQPRDRRPNRNHTQSIKSFTPEFKEQNALLMNGQVICRHFLHGKCIKGDSCQMQHIQACNDLIKESCKYYIQECCTKGEQCPYMHKSFPCKFFHKNGHCIKGENCRFSHDPLNDITVKLLNEAIELEMALAQKTEQSSAHPATDEPHVKQVIDPDIPEESNKESDKLVQPFRFNFYNSADSNAYEGTCPTEGMVDITEQDAQPHKAVCQSPLINLCPEPSVLYSVEAVLEPQLSPVFKNSTSPDPSTLSSPPTSCPCNGSANHGDVPYAVNVVLRSSKSTESSTLVHTAPAAALIPQVISYPPAVEQSSGSQDNKAVDLLPTENEANKVSRKICKKTSMFQVDRDIQRDHTSVPALSANITQAEESAEYITGPSSCKTCLYSLQKKENNERTTDTAFSTDHTPRPKSPTSGFQSLFLCPPGLTFAPKHSPPFKSHPLYVPCDFHTPSMSPQMSTQLKESAALAAASAKPFSDIIASEKPNYHLSVVCLSSKNTPSAFDSGAPQAFSSRTTTQDKTDCLDSLARGCNITLKTPFKKLFVSIVDTQSSTQDSETTSSSHNYTQYVSASPKSTYVKCQDSSIKRTAELDQAFARSLPSLFATPLGELEAPISFVSAPSMSQGNHFHKARDTAAPLLDAAQREAPLPKLVTDCVTQVPQASSSTENDIIVDSKPQNLKNQQSRSYTSATQQKLPVKPPYVDSSPAATTNSVLKTLFLCLSPYKQDKQ